MIRYQKINPIQNNRLPKTPVRANPSDAGLDVFYADAEDRIIEPGQAVQLGTGLRFEIPHGYMLQVCNRSSMGAKKSLIVGAHIIDSGYSGEVFIDLHNIGTENQVVRYGDKIAQLVMIPVVSFIPVEVNPEIDLYSDPVTISNRGEGALGSTGG